MQKGLAFIRWADEKPNCSFAKFMSEEELTALLNILGCEQGDVVLIVADKDRVVLPTLGQLRLTLGKQLELIPEGQYNFLWITEFPFFEWDEESQTWLAMHIHLPCLWKSACHTLTPIRVRFVHRLTTW